MNEVTRLLSAVAQGDPQAASQFLPLVYDELRQLAAARLAQEPPPERRRNQPRSNPLFPPEKNVVRPGACRPETGH
jgi:hypothetical protein